jgi:hypothetical protein
MVLPEDKEEVEAVLQEHLQIQELLELMQLVVVVEVELQIRDLLLEATVVPES